MENKAMMVKRDYLDEIMQNAALKYRDDDKSLLVQTCATIQSIAGVISHGSMAPMLTARQLACVGGFIASMKVQNYVEATWEIVDFVKGDTAEYLSLTELQHLHIMCVSLWDSIDQREYATTGF